jgi:DNA polymerase-3 subunit epsilon
MRSTQLSKLSLEFPRRHSMPNANTAIILDFETTGLSPNIGDRPIEIGAVKIENGEVTGRFQELMNPGQRVSGFIESYTGITNAMLKDAPPCREVMHRFADFIDGYNLVAHNASFDQRFLHAELQRISRRNVNPFACSMLAARRVYQQAPNHKLGTLVRYTNIPSDGVFHRALYDSEMTAKLWLHMLDTIGRRTKMPEIPFSLMQKLAKTPKHSVERLLGRCELRGQFT